MLKLHAGDPDVGGYDVSLTKAPSAAFVGLGNPPKKFGTNKAPSELALSPTRWNGGFMNGTSSSPYDRAAAAGNSVNSGSTSGSVGGNRISTSGSANAQGSNSSNSSTNSNGHGGSSNGNGQGSSGSSGSGNNTGTSTSGSGGGSSNSNGSANSGSSNGINNGSSSSGYTNRGPSIGTPASKRAVVGRRMLDATGQLVVVQSDDVLDYCRQGNKRAACAVQVRDWPEASIPLELDVQAYMEMVSQHEIVDILAEAARLLKE